MHDWCHEHAHSDDRRDADGIRIDFCRFYFTDEADAERFWREWLP